MNVEKRKIKDVHYGNANQKKRVSILDYHFEEIKSLREKGVSIMSIYKIINDKLPNKLTYNSYLMYCKKYEM